MDSSVKSKHRLRHWVEKRWPLSAVVRWGSVEEIPGGAKFAYVLGSATMVLFAVLVITGVWQLLYYVPAVDHAYDSVMFLRLQVPLGWLVHGLHYWAAQAFIVVMGLHLARVFIWAAYKKPRELTWVLGVVLLLLGAAFIFTGAILPWDTMGYWAGEVGTSVAGTVPLIGNFLKLLMRGGDTMGQMTLSRAFVVHVAILPALTVLFIAAHLVAFRQFGSVGPWNPKKREKIDQFWPDQVFKDLLVIAVILVVLICLSAFVRAPISGPADPLDNSFTPKPEWNFLFLYEALKAFKGSWEWMGTTVIPALLVLLLFAVPFIDRNEKKNPFQRPVAMLSGLLFVAVILVMTFIGHYSNSGANAPAAAAALASTNQTATPEASAPNPTAPKTALLVSTNAPAPASAAPTSTNQVAAPAASVGSPAKPEGSQTNTTSSTANIQKGSDLFVSAGCVSCHMIAGKGGAAGPDLSQEAKAGRSGQWLITQITDPATHNASTTMPAHKNLTEPQLKSLADYLLNPTASGGGATAIGLAAIDVSRYPAQLQADYQTFSDKCSQCHHLSQAIYFDYVLPDQWSGCIRRMMYKPGSEISRFDAKGIYRFLVYDSSVRKKMALEDKLQTLTPDARKQAEDAILAVSPPGSSVPATALAAPAPTNQAATPATSASSPATPAAAPSVSTNTPATASAAPAPTNRVAASATSAPGAARPEASQTNTTTSTANAQEGSGLFVSAGCVTCHMIAGKGGNAGPDLSHETKLGRSNQWLIQQITDPAKHNPSTTMPAHKNLTPQQLKGLADFILNPSPGAGTESKSEKQPSASVAQPAQEKQNTTNASPNSAQPAGGTQVAAGTIVKMIGDAKHGAVLFDLDCSKCHGKDGAGHVPNPGSQAGVVSPLAPIARGLFSDDPLVFAENIDRVIQHGVTPPGPRPTLEMPAFGDTRALTLPEIANIEAYVLSLNGVDAAKIIHPGITPVHFVEGTVALFALALLVVGGLWVYSRTSSLAQTGGHPSAAEFQTLQREVADLKHKLEARDATNSKDSSRSMDPQP